MADSEVAQRLIAEAKQQKAGLEPVNLQTQSRMHTLDEIVSSLSRLTDLVTATAEGVIVLHGRRDVSSCFCGWNKLGRMHSQHVVEKLREAGVLKETVDD